MNILGFDHRIAGDLPAIAGIPLFAIRIGVMRVHHLSGRAGRQLRGSGRLRRKRIDAEAERGKKLPAGQDARARAARSGAGVGNGGEQARVRLLLHEQRNVLENLPVIQAVAGAHDVLSAAGEVVSDAETRAEVLVLVVRERAGIGTADRLQFQVRARLRLDGASVEAHVLVPAQAEIQRQAAAHFPVILEIHAEHFIVLGVIGIAGGGLGDGLDRARRREALRVLGGVGENRERIVEERDHRGCVGQEESAQDRLPQIVDAGLEGMLAAVERDIVLELPLLLEGVLRHVAVGADGEIRKRQIGRRSCSSRSDCSNTGSRR